MGILPLSALKEKTTDPLYEYFEFLGE